MFLRLLIAGLLILAVVAATAYLSERGSQWWQDMDDEYNDYDERIL